MAQGAQTVDSKCAENQAGFETQVLSVFGSSFVSDFVSDIVSDFITREEKDDPEGITMEVLGGGNRSHQGLKHEGHLCAFEQKLCFLSKISRNISFAELENIEIWLNIFDELSGMLRFFVVEYFPDPEVSEM